ncbi:SpoIIE family protein phosphatase [Streptomyces sp. CA-251387]|uniref:SpoIIE family protein phosphatase n=1 Tax=Streptomyces sp. CA-251387 TaxID=3240064 RepID=UPI003D940E75
MPGNLRAPATARRFVRATLNSWARHKLPVETAVLPVEDALLLTSEVVTNAVLHAGTPVELCCRLENACAQGCGPAALVVEISDHYPSKTLLLSELDTTGTCHRGLHLVRTIAQSWGVSYRSGLKTVWFRLSLNTPATGQDLADSVTTHQPPAPDTAPTRAAEHLPYQLPLDEYEAQWKNRGELSFLAEASDLLSGQFDEDKVAALAGQLLVPRFADWCAVWLEPHSAQSKDAPRLARVWHARESLTTELRTTLEDLPCELVRQGQTWPVPLPWPPPRPAASTASQPRPATGAALACRLISAGRPVGTLILGQTGPARLNNEAVALVAEFARRLAMAIASARQYTQHATTSKVLQRGLLPASLAAIPNMDTHIVYEPVGEGATAGGDFYDLFRTNDGRWCFALGDVCGHGPEAAVVIGLIRPLLKLLAEDGYGVPKILDRLNQVLVDDALSAAEGTGHNGHWDEVRSLSLLYGELVPAADGSIQCTLASAGHPLPLLLHPDGRVYPVAESQLLLGVMEAPDYRCQTITLAPGDTLICVTDGVTERRSGQRQLDDDDGLSRILSCCAGLEAAEVAEQVRQAVYTFAAEPPHDDLALLVLHAR